MFDTQMVAELREMAVKVTKHISHAKGDGAVYLLGSRDMLLSLAKAYEKRCPLAVLFFNSPVIVTKEA